ncbi:MAG: hypothetical protein HY079_04290 [Elusimicrobia bacterium]|nr:hypothetical protein [Elusimicrobiota bacterium]
MRIETLLLAATLLGAAGVPAARAAEKSTAPDAVVKVVGYLVKLEVAADGKSAVATLLVKGKKVPITVTDELTLKKFKVKKIRTDDEIKCSYKEIDGKNLSVSFLRAAGC